ncbi:MAG: replication initiation protein [Oscillospiraceae bacterium]|nr:replication initiation protein [Oscillospiraceae bacterium]
MAIKKNFLVEKRNVLNEIRSNNMTMQELRFFTIYLSKINARDRRSRVVRFSVDEFARIMEFGSRIQINYLKNVTNNLLSKVVSIPTERGGWNSFQLFKECTVDQDKTGEWYVEIDAHDKALPLMFDFKREYFTYELWNALRLHSSNQIIMYELLKQYEKAGERIITVDRLRERLGFSNNEHPRFGDFKNRVLDVCQKAIAETTDIKFTYEPYGKKGPGGKILALKFTISKNANHIDQLTLSEFISEQPLSEVVIDADNEISLLSDDGLDRSNPYVTRIELLIEACNNEFTYEQIEVLNGMIGTKTEYEITFGRLKPDIEAFHYLANLYHEMNTHKDISHRFNYLKKMVRDYDD